MSRVKRIVLDVLKPHPPNVLEFARTIAAQDSGYRVNITVEAVDEKTETITVTLEGADIQFGQIDETITRMGGSIHSIDEVTVAGESQS
ncbi:DUF211 domain-containing protein [Nitrosococcus wardiae]|uniref:DUF211 domain-containing protein n=1 Tax=Nitrosococcus wardiae TaxID=1814290 RepID=A0A4P7C3C9_9GAMM|nr:DUF211 domain-containing protein [Nitrosococcus wardiae]QBQ56074.1 hypothetical protein E3U44_17330 [Nitrosococcus wardiae]